MSKKERIKVLILEGYARQCLPFAKSFKKLGCEVTLLCGSKSDLGYWSRYPHHKIVGICSPDKYDDSNEYICNLIKNGNYDIVVPLVDFSAKILAFNKEELSKFSYIATNNYDVFKKSQDKLEVMRICQEHSIPCPKTLFDIENVSDVLKSGIRFPIVVKPRTGYGARGFNYFKSKEEMLDKSNGIDYKDSVVQEYITQTNSNISVCLLINNDGSVASKFTYCSRRWFPLEGGTGTLNELVERPDAEQMCEKLASIIGLRGIVGFDLIDDPQDNIPKLIEINPRSLACAKIGFIAGINQAKAILDNYLYSYMEPQTIKKKKVFVRMSQIDFAWFLKSKNRWKAKPSWFKLSHTHDQTFSFLDPLPWFAFLFQGMKKYKQRKKTKQERLVV